MKSVLILNFILLATGCAGDNLRSVQAQKLNLSQILNLKINRSSEIEVEKIVGPPSAKKIEDSKEIWTFEDRESIGPLLTLTFSTNTHFLNSILWVPRVDDYEKKLSNVISKFPNLKIEPVNENDINPHSPIEDVTYRDSSAGQVVLVNAARASVVALAWYSRDARDIAVDPDANKKHFTIGK